METSIFMDKSKTPVDDDLLQPLGDTYLLWETIKKTVFQKYPKAMEEWNYPGKNYGWSFRIKDKKRAIIYLMPRQNYFKVAFGFGQKATDEVMNSDVSQDIKNELAIARVYAEGRGIRIDVKNSDILTDIIRLIEIKIAN